MLNDLVYALRNIAKQPLFYAVATVTLALGIGANAAVFTVVNAVLLRALPYPQPDRLMMVWTYNPRQGFDKDVATYPNFEDWRRASTLFERMSNIARGAPKAQIDEDEPGYRREPIDIPRFLNRQNNQ